MSKYLDKTGLTHFWGKIKALLDGKADSNHAHSNYAIKEAGVYYVDGSGSTKAGTWIGSNSNITSYYDGLIVNYKIGVAGASTTKLNINGLGAKTCYLRGTTKLTTQYGVGTMVLLAYNATTDAFYSADYDANSYAYARQYYFEDSDSYNSDYPVLLSYNTTVGTAGEYKTAYAALDSDLTYNPYTNKLNINGNTVLDTSSVDTALSNTSTNPVQNKAIHTALAGKSDTSHNHDDDYAPKTHSHDAATTSANGFMTAAMVTKLNGIATGANKTTVDTALSNTSTNPVQNKAVTTKFQDIEELFNDLNVDVTDALNLAQSNTEDIGNLQDLVGELEGAVNELQSGSGGGSNITVDTALSDTSTNPVQNKVVKQAIVSLQSELYDATNSLSGEIGIVSGMASSLQTSLNTAHQFKVITRGNMPTTKYFNLMTILSQNTNFTEFMVIIRTISTVETTIGVATNTSGSSGFICSKSVTGTVYNKLVIETTSDGYKAWSIGDSFAWDNTTSSKYLRYFNTNSTAITCSYVIYGR